MTEEQKEKMENLYNGCSLDREYGKGRKSSANNRMWMLEEAVEILGYRFEFKEFKKFYQIEYPTYRLVESNRN